MQRSKIFSRLNIFSRPRVSEQTILKLEVGERVLIKDAASLRWLVGRVYRDLTTTMQGYYQVNIEGTGGTIPDSRFVTATSDEVRRIPVSYPTDKEAYPPIEFNAIFMQHEFVWAGILIKSKPVGEVWCPAIYIRHNDRGGHVVRIIGGPIVEQHNQAMVVANVRAC